MVRPLLLLALLCCAPAGAAEVAVPQPLEPWRDWVLHDTEERSCPFLFNGGEQRLCAWPTRLELAASADGATFEQQWQVYREGWVALPGEAARWPEAVRVDGEPALLHERDGRPYVRLAPGAHRVAGHFTWETMPRTLALPEHTALLTLRVDGEAVPQPRLETDGRLWLQPPTPAEQGTPETHLALQVFRRLEDAVPARLETRLELDVAGPARELDLGPLFGEGWRALALDAPLPARLEPEGRLRLQVRPGRWTITVTARHLGPLTRVQRPPATAPWPTTELWAFEAHPQLRRVELDGVQTLDPRQTGLPTAWHRLPAFALAPDQTLRLDVQRRGDPKPARPQLTLSRDLWLNFDGDGYTVRDRIEGTLGDLTRLNAGPALHPGRANVDGEERLLTTAPGGTGIELRAGQVNLEVDGRLAAGALPAHGWDTTFQSVDVRLHLPPGWRLFSAQGPDSVATSWLGRWTLLDLFLVLIIALAAGRLWDWRWGALALLAVGLTYHEPGAPRWIWLFLLACAGLLQVLPPGRLHRVTGMLQRGGLLALALIALPFLLQQAREAVYPQLERPGTVAVQKQAAPRPSTEALAPPRADMALRAAPEMKSTLALERAPSPLPAYEPGARLQTGPGVPEWRWSTVLLRWGSVVGADEPLRLRLVPPTLQSLLNLLQIALIAGFAAAFVGLRYRRGQGWRWGHLATLPLLVFAVTLAQPQPAQAAFPPQPLLDELRARLLAPAECLPHCALVERLEVAADGERLALALTVHAQERVAVPLPDAPGHWRASHVEVDGAPAAALRQAPDGGLAAALEPGRHRVTLQGPLPGERLVLPLPLTPKRLKTDLQGWRLEAAASASQPSGQLVLVRERAATPEPPAANLTPGPLPPFVEVERNLTLGTDWRVHTRIVRRSPAGEALTLRIPLLPGAAVTSDAVATEAGHAVVTLAPHQRQAHWESVLEPVDRLVLAAPQTDAWTETWRLELSPIWHAEVSGLTPTRWRGPAGRWQPQWHPWPGEQATLALSRPRAVPGRGLTIERAGLELAPGSRMSDGTLHLQLRSGEGTDYTVTLPEGAALQRLVIDGREQPARQDGRRVTVALTPGEHRLQLGFRQPGEIGYRFQTPEIDLGTGGANASIDLRFPTDRWLLAVGGPPLGPAVLFWGLLLVLVGVAWALGRGRLTPLGPVAWFLLGLGLLQVEAPVAVLVAGWLLALGARGRLSEQTPRWRFNLTQIGLGALTLTALGGLFYTIQHGLLGHPEMQIMGNGSYQAMLRWYQDRIDHALPQAWVVSLPLWVYRVLMLAWALWIAAALIGWLRWGWQNFSRGGLWRDIELRRIGRREKRSEGDAKP